MSPEVLSKELELSEVEKITSIARRCIAGPGSVRREGEYFVAVEPNSFGLPSVDTCPGSTDYCEEDCYAIDSEKRTATHEKMLRNLDILQEAGDEEGMTEKLRGLVSSYQDQADRLKVPQSDRHFRIHWAGDFFSTDYANAWGTVIQETPDLNFFVYTRSFQPDVNVVPILAGIENLDLFMSVDIQNVDRAREVLKDYPEVRVAYLVKYYEEAAELIEKLDRTEGHRVLACPENMRKENGERKLPIIGKRGGACSVCTYCTNKRRNWDVIFVKKGLIYKAQGELPFSVPIEISRKKKQRDSIVQPIGATAIKAEELQESLFGVVNQG